MGMNHLTHSAHLLHRTAGRRRESAFLELRDLQGALLVTARDKLRLLGREARLRSSAGNHVRNTWSSAGNHVRIAWSSAGNHTLIARGHQLAITRSLPSAARHSPRSRIPYRRDIATSDARRAPYTARRRRPSGHGATLRTDRSLCRRRGLTCRVRRRCVPSPDTWTARVLGGRRSRPYLGRISGVSRLEADIAVVRAEVERLRREAFRVVRLVALLEVNVDRRVMLCGEGGRGLCTGHAERAVLSGIVCGAVRASRDGHAKRVSRG